MDIQCTQCGAEIPIQEDTDFIRCPFCETALYVDTDRTVPHLYIKPQAGIHDLGPMIQRKLAYLEIKDPVKVGSAVMFYFPFWRLDLAMGNSITIPAAAPPVEDMQQIKTPAGDQQLYDDAVMEDKEVVEPELLLEDAVMAAERLLDTGAVKFSKASLLHLPLFRVQYECQGGDHKALVDAVSGDVFSDEWPAPAWKEKDRALGLIALVAFIAFILEAVLLPHLILIILAYFLTAFGIYIIAMQTLARTG